MNKKNQKIIWILIAALIVAIAGGAALYHYLIPRKTTIYVFKESAKAGEVVTSDMLVAVQADSEIFIAGKRQDASGTFVTGKNMQEVLKSGDSLRIDVTPGMPLTLSMLTVNGGSAVEMTMDPTKIAISIPVTSITGVTNDLKTGSRVNVYVTGLMGEENGKEVYGTILLFQNMRVLAVDRDNNGELYSATLETTIEESLKLAFYSNGYTVSLGLIDSTGYEYSTMEEPSYSPGAAGNYYDAYENVLPALTEEEQDSEEPAGTQIDSNPTVPDAPVSEEAIGNAGEPQEEIPDPTSQSTGIPAEGNSEAIQ